MSGQLHAPVIVTPRKESIRYQARWITARHGGEEKKPSLLLPEQKLGCPVHSIVTTLSELLLLE
jgi:hypothetical protein